jgi:hypothetical protein
VDNAGHHPHGGQGRSYRFRLRLRRAFAMVASSLPKLRARTVPLPIHLWSSCTVHLCRRIDTIGNYLRANSAGGAALLEKPATIRANAAGWQRLDHCRNQLYKARRQTTIATIEVTAGFLLTRRSDAEDLCRCYR